MECAVGAGARIRRSSVIDDSRQTPEGLARFCGARPQRSGDIRCRAATMWPAMGRGVLALLLAALASACGTPRATDIGGRWQPVNRYAEAPQAIPLQQGYVYQASPADGTLKSMLGRWARDARVALSYEHPNDYTLHGAVAGIRTASLEQAAAALSSAYAGQGVDVLVLEQNTIVVRQRSAGGDGGANGRDG